MQDVDRYARWLLSGSWISGAPGGSRLTWGRLAASRLLVNTAVATIFAVLSALGLLSGVTVALLWLPAQAAVLVGLGYAACSEQRGSRS